MIFYCLCHSNFLADNLSQQFREHDRRPAVQRMRSRFNTENFVKKIQPL
ncbi:hypothetical protein NIES2104_00460 [Leptolyngbya sp. NIES-2104]|nr:hypothetical protein NIES2104_00460 [Leptolyngbya sp. NIES-2104]